MRGRWFVSGCALALALAGCSSETVPADGSVEGGVLVPVAVETVAPESVRAGQPVGVDCLLIDASGEAFVPPSDVSTSLRFVPESSVTLEAGVYTAIRAGEVEVSCVVSSLRMSDDTPSVVRIDPGHPVSVVTRLDLDSVEAGQTSRASCDVYDAYGNRVQDAEPTVRSEPEREGNSFDGTLGTFERAGRFDVYCELPGAESQGAEIEVRPGIPASLVISRVPDQPIYARGQAIDIARLAADRFGNPIPDAVIPVSSDPAGQMLGDGRYRYVEDGIYTLTATVQPPTEGDIPLSQSTTVIVDGSGPAISCDDPLDGAILDRRPGGQITFQGTVEDLSGVTEVRVNGEAVAVDASGAFSAPLTTRFGVNFVDLASVDSSGQEASRTCAFLVADVWAPDTRTFSDTLSLRLRQAAFDDSNRDDGLDSMADVLDTVLNSAGLRDTLHSTLLANNPLKPNSCDESVWGVCVLRSEVIYLDSQINGPNTTRLELIDGGMRARVRVEDLRVRIRVRGHVAGIPYDTRGWSTFDYVEVEADFNARLRRGRPQVTVRAGSVSTEVGSISTDFSGLDGAIVDIVVALFQGRVRDLIAGLVTDWVTDNFNGILDDVLGGLDVESLGTSFDVPRLDTDQTLPLTFGVGFSSLSTTPQRMLFGLGTRFSTPPVHARPTRGAPVQRGTRRLDAGGAGSTAVAVHETILNQALHALWRGGFFDVALGGSAIGGDLPEGIDADMTLGMTPVAMLRDDGRVELSLGSLVMQLTYPELFAEPVLLTLGARGSMAARLVGEDLVFEGFRVEEMYFSTDLASLSMDNRDRIEELLRRLLERIIRPALNDALPAIPIPSFTLPSSLSAYDLPVGAELGIVGPTMSPEPPHFVLRGNFAVR